MVNIFEKTTKNLCDRTMDRTLLTQIRTYEELFEVCKFQTQKSLQIMPLAEFTGKPVYLCISYFNCNWILWREWLSRKGFIKTKSKIKVYEKKTCCEYSVGLELDVQEYITTMLEKREKTLRSSNSSYMNGMTKNLLLNIELMCKE